MQHLLSKLVAGGLSAAVILLWWPLVFPSDTVESWLVRGIVWTASFELMLHAFMPVEESLWRSRAARRVRDQAARAGGRIAADSPERKMRWRTGVACVALTVPLSLLASAPSHPLGPKAAAEQVREVTKVKRIVRVETKRVKVRQPVATAAAPAGGEYVPARRASATVPAARSRSVAPAPRRSTGRRTTSRPTADATPTTPTQTGSTGDQAATGAQPPSSGATTQP